MPQRILDACCLINLYAAGNTPELLRSFEGNLFVPELIKAESLFIRRPDDEDDAKLIPDPIDLSLALAEGWLRECSLENNAEAEEFVRFARIVDDGEAVCLALAKCRGWAMATDDRKALRVANDERVATVTTPELIKHWADSCQAKNDAIAAVLRNIERFARFTPRKGMSLSDWWARLVGLPGG
jgi:hypothetical protein